MNREQLLAVQAKRVQAIDVAGVGRIHVRVLSARESLGLEAMLMDGLRSAEKMGDLVTGQLAAFICDEAGAPLLSKEDAQQIIERWSAVQVRTVIKAGTELNALNDEAVEGAGGN